MTCLAVYRENKTNKGRDKEGYGEGGKGEEEEEEEEEIQDINTYTNTNLIPPRRFRSELSLSNYT